MATILKYKKGWRVQIRKGNITRSAIFRTKAEAQAWALDVEANISLGIYSTTQKHMTFADLINKYISEVSIHKKTGHAESLKLSKIADSALGQVLLIDLKQDHFIDWKNERLSQVKSSTVLREWATLSNLFKIATNQWKLIKDNPLENIKRPNDLPPRTRRFADHEITSILFAADYHEEKLIFSQYEKTAAAMLFAIETAMRASEICNAKWEHISIKNRILHLPETKNGYARDVPLSQKAFKIVQQLDKSNSDSEFIFRLTAKQLDYSFRRLKDKAGLKNADLHFHDTRREALSRLAKKVDVMCRRSNLI